jgi:alpha-tubulin suppressor-like RCC1 family protein
MSQILSTAGSPSWGLNDNRGILARQSFRNQKLDRIETALPPIRQIACGLAYNILLTFEGEVFVSGYGPYGSFGFDGDDPILIPTRSDVLSNLRPFFAACHCWTTVLVTKDGRAYSCGYGWGDPPVELRAPSLVAFVACGGLCGRRICAIGFGGEFFLWESDGIEAKMFACERQFCDCAVGHGQVFALSTVGILYVCGSGIACGQSEDFSAEELTAVLSLAGINIRRIFAHHNRSFAIDENGKVFACGWNTVGKLGLGDIDSVSIFERVTVFDDRPVIDIAIGYAHTAFITKDLGFWTCGDGSEFETCNETTERVKFPKQAELAMGKSVMAVACGLNHTIIAENLSEMPKHPGRMHFGLE